MYKIGIIGAGQISSGYDSPKSNNCLTHAHAISTLDTLFLEGFYDKDLNRLHEAAEKWDTKPYMSAEELVRDSDIIVCAVPDKYHYNVLKEILTFGNHLNAVICEKPLALNLDQASEICELYKSRGVSLTVNYSRRFINGFAATKQRILDFGELVRGNCYYGKGLFHNGSHMINLIDYVLDLTDVGEIGILESVIDYLEEDRSISFFVTLHDKARIYFQVIPCNITSVFQFELFFEKGKLVYDSTQEKVFVYKVGTWEKYENYTRYQQSDIIETNRSEAMLNLYHCVLNSIDNGIESPSSGEDALRTIRICNEVVRKEKCITL